jgi:hypothetical protein
MDKTMNLLDIHTSLDNLDSLYFKSSLPIKHLVIDNFLPEFLANKISEEWPIKPSVEINTEYNKRVFFRDFDHFGEHTKLLVNYLNSSLFLNKLCDKLEFEELYSDLELENGGLHETKRGGFLGMHLDNLLHSTTGRLRKLNLIVYFEKNWPANNGGNLVIESLESGQSKEIEPLFNRAVIFELNRNALHGAPAPVQGINNSTRKSLALFYYGEILSSNNSEDTRTFWKSTNGLHTYKGDY